MALGVDAVTNRLEARRQALVLVVEDDVDVLNLMSLTLRLDGFRVVEAATGVAGLQAVTAHDVDLVLLDNHLPDMRGRDVLRGLRADPETAALPVILVTGDASAADRVAGLDAGATDYVVKPFEPE